MDRHPGLARVAVELLADRLGRTRGDLAGGARRAIELGLAGIYHAGLQEMGVRWEQWDQGLLHDLSRARRSELAHALAFTRQAREVLEALARAGVTPLVLKGRPLAERLWPRPWMRPPGDLDLLVEDAALGDTLAVLLRLGYRALAGAPPGRWRPAIAEVHMRAPSPSSNVDVHTRLFRTFGSALSAGQVLARAHPGTLDGVPIRRLDPADEVLFLLIHAAKHARVHPKWVLDAHAAARGYGPEWWTQAADRALAAGATRACWATLRLLESGPPGPVQMEARMRPRGLARLLIPRAIGLAGRGRHVPRNRAQDYLVNWLLEDRLSVRLRRFLGVMERLMIFLFSGMVSPRRSVTTTELRNRRWLERALRPGQPGPLWVTLEGLSMAPSLLPGDQLLVTPLHDREPVRPGEVVVARRAGRLVAHRVMRASERGVVTRGDGARSEDPPIPAGEVLARVIATRRVQAQET